MVSCTSLQEQGDGCTWNLAPYSTIEQDHPNDGNIIVFVQDTFQSDGLPMIHKLPINMFEGAKDWFHPCITTLKSKDPADYDVLLVLDWRDTV